MSRLKFEVTAEGKNSSARVGAVTTANGTFKTPCFMPVGTRAAVKTLSSTDLETLGVEIVLANTYHLMLRPGDELIKQQGGLHKFMSWNRPILTDSGGFQILSLKPKISQTGAVFQSTYDDTQVELTPEKAVEIQNNLGSDIQMVLDVCPDLSIEDKEQVLLATETTHNWAIRARKAFLDSSSDLAQFGIVQGGLDIDLRKKSADQICQLDFEGYAIGGLSVGETRQNRNSVLDKTTSLLPKNKPRYLMGVGDPLSLIESIQMGIDMFDCVLPTRLARHGTALTTSGKINISAATYREDSDPLDPEFEKSPANRWPRSYLRHLFSVNEPTAAHILTLHNLAFLFELMKEARANIEAGTFSSFYKKVRDIWND